MAKGNNVFISWSGSRSLRIAETLRGWLPKVVQAAKPWMSGTDIDKGARGLEDLARALEDKKVGIVCLTPENLSVPWLLFEAGALSKTIDDKTRLCTYLIGGLEPQDVKPPLGQFQATRAEKEETRKLVQSVNKAVSEDPIPAADLDDVFNAMWVHVEKALEELPPVPEGAPARRSVEDMVAEILELVRAEANRPRLVGFSTSAFEDEGIISPANIALPTGGETRLNFILPTKRATNLAATLVNPATPKNSAPGTPEAAPDRPRKRHVIPGKRRPVGPGEKT